MKLVTGNIHNFLIDALDAFGSCETGEDSWQLAQKLVREQGGNAFNYLTLSPGVNLPTYFRSGMDERWLEQYAAESYLHHDILIERALADQDPGFVVGGGMRRDEARSELEYEFINGLADYDYNFVLGMKFGNRQEGQMVGCSFSTETRMQEITQSHIENMRLLSAVIVSNIELNFKQDAPGVIKFHESLLSPRELDVISYLAKGLRNDQIADKLNVAEITVRKHLTSARVKLKASTREQAIVTAMKFGLLHI